MEQFKLSLPNGATVSGHYTFPPIDFKTPQNRPLLVCIAGGSYDSRYFDVQGAQSILSISNSLNIPVIAIDRPGYGASTPAPDAGNELTYAQAQGRYLNSIILPALWETFADRAGASTIVLLSHSIGAMIATISAGSYTGLENYPLAGLITSGIGSELVEGPSTGMLHLLEGQDELVHFEPNEKDAIMLQLPHRNLTPVEMREFTVQLNQPVPRAELLDINTTWLGYWKEYSTKVRVPLFYGLAEFDGLWTCSTEAVDAYKAAFPHSPKVGCEVIPKAPHCIELSYQSQAWYLKCFAFAIECTVSRSLHSPLPDNDAA